MKLVRIRLGHESLILDGNPLDSADRRKLAAAFDAELAAGTFAFVPTGLVAGCCRRGLAVERFEDVPTDAPVVRFLKRQQA